MPNYEYQCTECANRFEIRQSVGEAAPPCPNCGATTKKVFHPLRELYQSPRHPYTHGLLEAVPEPELAQPLAVELSGDAPDPIKVPTGCRFHPRCRLARQVAGQAGGQVRPTERVPQVCASEEPALREIVPEHFAACHFAERMPQELDATSGERNEVAVPG